MTASDTTPNTASVGLVFDINPADPAVISVLVLVGVALLLAAVCFRNGKSARSGVGGEEGEEEEEEHEEQTPETTAASRPRYNTRGRRVSSPGSGGSPAGKAVTPQQAALCEVLYDVYAGVVPARGIESKTVRECHLSTAEIRRQFKKIKQVREAAGSSGGSSSSSSSSRASPSLLTRPATRRAAAAAAAKQTPQPLPMKPPVSPRCTPVKRAAASRSAPSTPRSVKRSAAAQSPSPPKAKASVLPSPPRLRAAQSSPGSPVATRGKSSRAPSVRVGSPKSTPTKRAAAAAAVAAGGGGSPSVPSPRSAGGTPSKRGKPSVLEIARREAQQQAAGIASTRASNLRAQASSGGKRRTKS